MPRPFRADFLENPENPMNLLGSKAVGEPPFVLGFSVWAAAKQALCRPSPGTISDPEPPGHQRGDLEASRRRHGEPTETMTPETDEDVEIEIHARAQF